MKLNRKELLLTTLVCLLPAAAGALLYSRLPEIVPTHWGLDGTADGWMPKAAAVFGLPALVTGIHLICSLTVKRDPRSKNISTALQTVTMWICPAVSLLCSSTTLCAGLGCEVHISTVVPLFVGVLFLIIGNYLPKTKQNSTMGIRLPWTLSSEENWNRTHRMTGFLWTAAGALCILFTLLNLWSNWLTGCLIVLAAIPPLLYSYYLHRMGI